MVHPAPMVRTRASASSPHAGPGRPVADPGPVASTHRRMLLVDPRNPLVQMTKTRRSPWNRYRIWRPPGLMAEALMGVCHRTSYARSAMAVRSCGPAQPAAQPRRQPVVPRQCAGQWTRSAGQAIRGPILSHPHEDRDGAYGPAPGMGDPPHVGRFARRRRSCMHHDRPGARGQVTAEAMSARVRVPVQSAWSWFRADQGS